MMACGGGGKSPVWRQMLADLYNCTVRTVAMDEDLPLGSGHTGPAWDAAFIRMWRQPAAGSSVKRAARNRWEEEAAVYAGYHRIYQNLYRSPEGRL